MAQSIYVAFAETFPDSYKQFSDDFKEFLLQVVFEWMTGTTFLFTHGKDFKTSHVPCYTIAYSSLLFHFFSCVFARSMVSKDNYWKSLVDVHKL